MDRQEVGAVLMIIGAGIMFGNAVSLVAAGGPGLYYASFIAGSTFLAALELLYNGGDEE